MFRGALQQLQHLGALSISSSSSPPSAASAIACVCEQGAVEWIQFWFRDCVYTSWDLLGFLVGLSSVFFWMIAQMPQFLTNILRQSAEALSPWFLFQWLAGDTLNLLGCVLTGDQLSTETFTAYYFILADCLILSQYFYYQARGRDRGYYSDDSVHKPANGYQTAIMIHSAAPAAATSTSIANCSSNVAAQRTTKQQQRTTNAKLPFGIMARGERFQDIEEGKLKHHQVAHSGQQATSAQTCALRRDLRKIVMEYGLEYGPASVSRITAQDAVRISRIELRSSSGSRHPQLKLKSLCVSGIVTLGFSGRQAAAATTAAAKDAPLSSYKTGWRSRKLLALCSSSSDRLSWMKQTGLLFGWVSAGLYLGSRLSQLVRNNQRKSAEGLSLTMVCCAVLANFTYGTAIIMRLRSWEDLMAKLPWLIGSLGTVSLDITIFLQAQYLSSSSSSSEESTERTPLL